MTYRKVNVTFAALLGLGLILVAVAIQTRARQDEGCRNSDLLSQPRHPDAADPFIDDVQVQTLNLIEAEFCRPLPYPRDLRGLHIEGIGGQRGSRDHPVELPSDSLGDYATNVIFASDELQTGRLRLEVSPFPLDERSYFTSPQEEPRLSDVKVQGKLATVTQAMAPAGSINITWRKNGFYFRAFCNFGEGNNGRFTLEDALRILNSIR